MSLLCGQHFRLRCVTRRRGGGRKSPICDGKGLQKNAEPQNRRDAPDDMCSLDKVPEEVSPDGDSGHAIALNRDVRMLCAEEVGLQARFDDVKRAGHNRAAHPAQAA